jgi:hypothetical protein
MGREKFYNLGILMISVFFLIVTFWFSFIFGLATGVDPFLIMVFGNFLGWVIPVIGIIFFVVAKFKPRILKKSKWVFLIFLLLLLFFFYLLF